MLCLHIFLFNFNFFGYTLVIGEVTLGESFTLKLDIPPSIYQNCLFRASTTQIIFCIYNGSKIDRSTKSTHGSGKGTSQLIVVHGHRYVLE